MPRLEPKPKSEQPMVLAVAMNSAEPEPKSEPPTAPTTATNSAEPESKSEPPRVPVAVTNSEEPEPEFVGCDWPPRAALASSPEPPPSSSTSAAPSSSTAAAPGGLLCCDVSSLDGVSLEAVGKLWAKWGIHGLILVSFGLQVFLFFAAGLRRRSASRILRSLLWLAYLSADSVAIFVLGHLAVQATGPRHQLLFLWAPLVLLHLGGQQTITAFSMLDNELWRRHLLGLVTQVIVAGYVVSRSSWSDRRLLAAMVLMFLCGCLRYAERTLCLQRASPAKLKESSLDSLSEYAREARDAGTVISINYKRRIGQMLEADGSIPDETSDEISSSAAALVLDTPLNDIYSIKASPSLILRNLQKFKSNRHSCRAYNYVGTRLILIYDCLYTKAPLYSIFEDRLKSCGRLLLARIPSQCHSYNIPSFIFIFLFFLPVFTLLVLFPLLSTSATLVLFVVAKKDQLYSQADIIVTYILLIGAIILEAMSLFIATSKDIFQVSRKQWSEMLGQYNMIKSLTRQEAAGMMSFVPQWISKKLDDKAITHTPISEDLKKFVLDKLLDFGTRKQDWNFANFRGQLALQEWKSNQGLYSIILQAVSRTSTPLHKSINNVEFPTSVLVWHIATDILYFQDNGNTNYGQQMKELSKVLSNYIMYLVFKCGVMLTSTTKFLHNNARREMERCIEQRPNLCEKDAMKKVFEANKSSNHTRSSNDPTDQIQLLKNTSEILSSELLPRACEVAQELIDIERESDRWNLISSVWLEMLYYIAPRCGGAFHANHLATGGEFITHVLFLMQLLGPFLPPPGA